MLIHLGNPGYNEHALSTERQAVAVELLTTSDRCPSEFPLLIKIYNGSSKTLNEIEWHIAAYRPGYSTDLSQSGFRKYSSDKIIQRGDWFEFCYGYPKIPSDINPKTLIYKVQYTSPYLAR